MNFTRKALFAGLFLSVIFYLIATGCTWITFTADDYLFDRIQMKSGSAIDTIYFELSGDPKDQGAVLGDFERHLKGKLVERGYTIVASPKGADLAARLRIKHFKKNEGTKYFFFGLIPNDGFNGGTHKVEGTDIHVSYSTDKGRWGKVYRAYGTDSYSKIATEIIADLNLVLITKKLEGSKKE
ncbi:MAG: hypothetical protein NTZ63_03270 [Candidatus Omnitrophica bacterium]|nr:hypothetical protein [Candidatus Omnitrophota bacterium]